MSPIEIQKYEELAAGLCDMTLNSPNEGDFHNIVALWPAITEIEKARLRICLTVAQARLFVWLLRKFPAIVLERYGTALRSGLTKNNFAVTLEDYVISDDERTALLSDHSFGGGNRHSIQISDLVFRLMEIRREKFDASIRVDLESADKGVFPLLETSRLVMNGFLGKDSSIEPYAAPMIVMIGTYFATRLTGIYRYLFQSS